MKTTPSLLADVILAGGLIDRPNNRLAELWFLPSQLKTLPVTMVLDSRRASLLGNDKQAHHGDITIELRAQDPGVRRRHPATNMLSLA